MGKQSVSDQEKLEYCIENVDEIKSASDVDFITALDNCGASYENLSLRKQAWVDDIYERLQQ